MIIYRATLDVPATLLRRCRGWLAAHRRARDRAPWQRAATPYVQAVLVLRWFKTSTDPRVLARDAMVSIATAYRYLREGIDAIAAHAPQLPDVLGAGIQRGWAFACPDGTLIDSTRSAARSAAGHDPWYSGKHKRHGGNIQVLTVPDRDRRSSHDSHRLRHDHPRPRPGRGARFYRDALGLEVRMDVPSDGVRSVIVGAPGQDLDVVLFQSHGGLPRWRASPCRNWSPRARCRPRSSRPTTWTPASSGPGLRC